LADERRTPPTALSAGAGPIHPVQREGGPDPDDWPGGDRPEDRLLAEPHAFGFYYAMRLLECKYRDWPRLGKAGSPVHEPIRLGQDCSMAFAPSTISSCGRLPPSDRLRLGVAFFGLFGPNGPLPLHLTEYAIERQWRRDFTFSRFADLFHHRLLCLFYRGWSSAQPTVSFDRPAEDRFGEYLASLCGYGLPSLRHRDAMLDAAKLYFAGRLQCGAKNAEGLEAIVGDYFQVTAAITEFVGEWLEIAPQDRCMLGATPATGSLGVTAIAGAFAFECQHKFRVHIGPLGLPDFEGFLPAGENLSALVAVVRNYAGDQYLWDLNLILRREEVPALVIGAPTARLGWTTWLGTRRSEKDADDLILKPPMTAPKSAGEGDDGRAGRR